MRVRKRSRSKKYGKLQVSENEATIEMLSTALQRFGDKVMRRPVIPVGHSGCTRGDLVVLGMANRSSSM
jgi:hypothetical protein